MVKEEKRRKTCIYVIYIVFCTKFNLSTPYEVNSMLLPWTLELLPVQHSTDQTPPFFVGCGVGFWGRFVFRLLITGFNLWRDTKTTNNTRNIDPSKIYEGDEKDG